MARTAVIYATKTMHSKKLAEAVASALNVKAENIKDNPVLKDIELLFIVGGIYGGVSMPELLEYVKGLDTAPKQAVLITNCASGKQKQTGVRGILEGKGIKVIDEFVCRGSMLLVSAGHPNAADLKEAADFAVRIIGR